MYAQCQRWSGGLYNQEVGLEAAILQSKRNSSLVKLPCAENLPGLKHTTDVADYEKSSDFCSGKGAFATALKRKA